MNPSLDKLNLAVVTKMQVNAQRDGVIVTMFLITDCAGTALSLRVY